VADLLRLVASLLNLTEDANKFSDWPLDFLLVTVCHYGLNAQPILSKRFFSV